MMSINWPELKQFYSFKWIDLLKYNANAARGRMNCVSSSRASWSHFYCLPLQKNSRVRVRVLARAFACA
jgi:hypothetical protein